MTRRATFSDLPRIAALVHEMHAASKYAGRVGISEKALSQFLLAAVAGQNQTGPQASLVEIAEQGGQIVGFIVGTLARVYNIGDRLSAQDLFLHVRKGVRADHTLALVDAYVEWAKGNRKVAEIVLSWSDALPGASRVARLYERKGFGKTGEMYELRLGGEGEAR